MAIFTNAEIIRILTNATTEQKQAIKTLLDVKNISYVSSIPPNNQGQNGDAAFNDTTGELYFKSGGTWTSEINFVTQAELATAISGVSAGTGGDPRIEVVNVPVTATGMSCRVANQLGGLPTLPGLSGTDYQEPYYDLNLKQFIIPNNANGNNDFPITLADLAAINSENRRDDVEGTRFWVTNLKSAGNVTFTGGGIASITPSGGFIRPGYSAFITLSPFSLSAADPNRHFRLVIAAWYAEGAALGRVSNIENALSLVQTHNYTWKNAVTDTLTITASTAESNANRRRNIHLPTFTSSVGVGVQVTNWWNAARIRGRSLTVELKMRIAQVASGTAAQLRIRLRNSSITTHSTYHEVLNITRSTSDSGNVEVYHKFRIPNDFGFVTPDTFVLQLEPIFPSSGAATSIVVSNIELEAIADYNPQNAADISGRLEDANWRNPRFSEMVALWEDLDHATGINLEHTNGFSITEDWRNFELIIFTGGNKTVFFRPSSIPDPWGSMPTLITFDATNSGGNASLSIRNTTTSSLMKFGKGSEYPSIRIRGIYGLR